MSFPRAVATVLLMMIKEEVFQFAFFYQASLLSVIKCCLQNYKQKRT